MSDEPKTNEVKCDDMTLDLIPDDTPRFVDKRRRGIDPRFFPPMELPAKPVQGELFGRRKPS